MYRKYLICVIVTNMCFYVDCKRVKRVIDGVEVGCGTQPRIVSLQNATTAKHLCGAYILSRSFALTAAHCISQSPDEYELQLRNFCGDPPQAHVLDKIVHDLYDKRSGAHDVALLRISIGLDDLNWLDGNVLPASSFGLSGECIIYGYGSTDPYSATTSETLMGAKVNVVSLDLCRQALGVIAPSHTDGMMCAVGETADSCQGDSGSPLICSSEVHGISSYGLSCGVPAIPGVYTSVGAHLQWIKRVMNEWEIKNDNPTNQPPNKPTNQQPNQTNYSIQLNQTETLIVIRRIKNT